MLESQEGRKIMTTLQYICRCSVYAHPCRCEDCGEKARRATEAEVDRFLMISGRKSNGEKGEK